MFKKRGSITTLSVLVCLICAAFGIFYGFTVHSHSAVATDMGFARNTGEMSAASLQPVSEPRPQTATAVMTFDDANSTSSPQLVPLPKNGSSATIGTASFAKPD